VHLSDIIYKMLVDGSYRSKATHSWLSNGSGSMVKQGLDWFEFRVRGVNGKFFLSQLICDPNVLKVAKPKFCVY
jgi:hypothetical protein